MNAILIPPANIDGATFPTCSITLKAEYNPNIADNKPTIHPNKPRDLVNSLFLKEVITTATNNKVNIDIVKTPPCKKKSII